MEAKEEWKSSSLDKTVSCKQNGRSAIERTLQNLLKSQNTLQIQSITHSECAGSCPNLIMSRNELPIPRSNPVNLTPQLLPRVHRPLCVSVSSDSSGRFKALETPEWKNNLKAQESHRKMSSLAILGFSGRRDCSDEDGLHKTVCLCVCLYMRALQMDQAHSAGAASSTGSLERASLFCASAAAAACSSGVSSPVSILNKSKSSSRFSLFSPPWNSSSESDSNPPSRSGSKKLCNYSRRAATGPAGAQGPNMAQPRLTGPEPFQYSEPVISKVTDYIYVGNLNAAYSGRTLCRNNIDSIIDMSSVPGEPRLGLIPCTCSRGARHSWSRLKVDIGDTPDAIGDGLSLRQCCFEDINECIDASTEKRKRVLVHCRDGFSLAPTCIIQYLMVKQNMKLIAAYELLRAKYPVNIKECHQNVLVSLERALRPQGNVDPECFKQAISRKVAWT